MRCGGQYVKKALPMIHFFGTGPQSRLSSLSPRLSPIMKKWPGGIVISREVADLAVARTAVM